LHALLSPLLSTRYFFLYYTGGPLLFCRLVRTTTRRSPQRTSSRERTWPTTPSARPSTSKYRNWPVLTERKPEWIRVNLKALKVWWNQQLKWGRRETFRNEFVQFCIETSKVEARKNRLILANLLFGTFMPDNKTQIGWRKDFAA